MTKFGDILPPWDNVKITWAILKGFISYLAKFWDDFGNFVMPHLPNLNCCKWPKAEQII